MKTQACRFLNSILLPCIACLLMVSFLVFGQEQPPQQNQPAPGGPIRPQGARSPMSPRMPGPGMRGPNGPRLAPVGLEMEQRTPMADLLRPEIQKELVITAEQRQKLEDIRFNSEKESIQHRAALQIQHLELSHMIAAENPDRAAIDKKIQEVAQTEAALMRSSINTRLSSRAVLTVEQRTKLAQFMQSRMRAERPQAEGGMQPGQPAPKAGPARERPPMPVAPAKQ